MKRVLLWPGRAGPPLGSPNFLHFSFSAFLSAAFVHKLSSIQLYGSVIKLKSFRNMRNERRETRKASECSCRERCVIHIKIVARHLTAPLMEAPADESRVSAQNGGSAMAAESPGSVAQSSARLATHQSTSMPQNFRNSRSLLDNENESKLFRPASIDFGSSAKMQNLLLNWMSAARVFYGRPGPGLFAHVCCCCCISILFDRISADLHSLAAINLSPGPCCKTTI